jgi:hypothetical protein
MLIPNSPAQIPGELLSVPEAALALKVNPKIVWFWIQTGRVPAYGTHRTTRVILSEVLASLRIKPRRPTATHYDISERYLGHSRESVRTSGTESDPAPGRNLEPPPTSVPGSAPSSPESVPSDANPSR